MLIMINLIQSEIYKLVRNKTFGYLMMASFILSFVLHILIIVDWWQLGGTSLDIAGLGELNTLNIYLLPLFFNILVSTLGAFYISNEFSQNGQIKNPIISGKKRYQIFFSKYFVFTVSSIVISVLLPILTGIISVYILGHGEIFTTAKIIYLGIAIILFIFQFLSFTAIVFLIAMITGDSGKTILFTLLLTIFMLLVEKLSSGSIVEPLYHQTVFHQYSLVLKFNITSAEVIHSIFIGSIWFIILLLCNIFVMNRREIK